jgi:hypothetical protein
VTKKKKLKTKDNGYYVEFGTRGTVGTVFAKNLPSAKKKARSELRVRRRGSIFSH